MNSLSMFEIEYMLHCILVSSFKIFGISKNINQEELSLFIDSHFFEDARINISQLNKWACESSEIIEYFVIIKNEPPKVSEILNDDENMRLAVKVDHADNAKPDSLLSTTISTEYIRPLDLREYLSSAEYKQMNTWIIDLNEKVNHYDSITERGTGKPLKLKGVEVELEWVYGFRCTDVVDSFSYYLQ